MCIVINNKSHAELVSAPHHTEPLYKSFLNFDFFILTSFWALPSARALRSYCTGLSHMAGIRCNRSYVCN
jgi:hypothetical protein